MQTKDWLLIGALAIITVGGYRWFTTGRVFNSPPANDPGRDVPAAQTDAMIAHAYLERPLANDALLENYSKQGMGVGNYAAHSLLGNKYVAEMKAIGATSPYSNIWGGL